MDNSNTLSNRYPDYEIDRSVAIYNNPNDLNEFVDACFLELSLHEGNFDNLTDFLGDLLARFETYIDHNFPSDYELPYYLRAFTAGEKFISSFSFAVDLLIEQEDYLQAVAFLKLLAAQHIYSMNEIGDWYFKLVRILVC